MEDEFVDVPLDDQPVWLYSVISDNHILRAFANVLNNYKRLKEFGELSRVSYDKFLQRHPSLAPASAAETFIRYVADEYKEMSALVALKIASFIVTNDHKPQKDDAKNIETLSVFMNAYYVHQGNQHTTA